MRYADGSEYEGEWKADQRDGRATYKYAVGDVYEGEWKAGKMEGRSTYRYADGDVYEGEWKADKKEGRGTFRYADGEVEVGRYALDADVGEGARWSADRRTAWRLRDGEVVGEISLDEARQIARAVGEPVPKRAAGSSTSSSWWRSR